MGPYSRESLNDGAGFVKGRSVRTLRTRYPPRVLLRGQLPQLLGGVVGAEQATFAAQ